MCVLLLAGCSGRSVASRGVEFSAEMADGEEFRVWAPNADITVRVTPGETRQCKGMVAISARALTQRGAANIVKSADVNIEEKNSALIVGVETDYKSVAIVVTVTLPKGTKVDFTSENGNVIAVNADGPTTAESQNGRIVLKDISGTIFADTQNGSVLVDYSDTAARSPKIAVSAQNGGIVCRGVAGDLKLESQNGSIEAIYTRTAGPSPTVSMGTMNGSITLALPAGLDAQVEMSTVNGAVSGIIPAVLNPKPGDKKLKGTVGSGKGSIMLKTTNGSIRLQ